MTRLNYSFILPACLISALGGLLFGYDWVVIGGAKIFYENYFNIIGYQSLQGWIMSCALLGCLVGALTAGALSDRYGRKKMLILAAVLFTLSAVGVGAADNITVFVVFRIIGGLGIGIASGISPVYIAEFAPTSIRGKFVSLNQMTVVMGILLAQIVNWLISAHYSIDGNALNPDSINLAWRWMFWMGAFPAVIFLICALFIPESPRWLAANGRVEAASRIFSNIGGADYAEAEIAAVKENCSDGEEFKIGSLFRKPLAKVLCIGIVVAVFQQWCGINVIFNYAHDIFAAAGYDVSEAMMNIAVTGVTNVVFTFVALFMVDRWGRRTLMIFGSAALTVIYAIFGTAYKFNVSGFPMLVLVVMAIAAYAMSLAAVVWVILSEIFPARARGLMMSISTFFLWVGSFFLTYTFPMLNSSLGASGTFWLYGVICLAGLVFVLAYLPETKGKSLEEIEKEITK
ncbi:MAG: sugar porter family MFS transporter [Candidatus Cryptobacteroides sp.]